MKKSIFLFAILLIGALTISASLQERIHGKWYVHTMKMPGDEQEFNDEGAAPWIEFKDDNVLLLGDPKGETQNSGWRYDKVLGFLYLDSFGEELVFKVTTLTESQLIMKASNEGVTVITLALKRHL